MCIDGGGLRGLISLEILRKIESSDSRGRTLSKRFDEFVGTSIGGIIVLLLADGWTVGNIQKLCFRLKDKVFSGRKGHTRELENILKEKFGDRLIGSLPKR